MVRRGVEGCTDGGRTAGSLYLICTAALGCSLCTTGLTWGAGLARAERRLAVSSSHACRAMTTQTAQHGLDRRCLISTPAARRRDEAHGTQANGAPKLGDKSWLALAPQTPLSRSAPGFWVAHLFLRSQTKHTCLTAPVLILVLFVIATRAPSRFVNVVRPIGGGGPERATTPRRVLSAAPLCNKHTHLPDTAAALRQLKPELLFSQAAQTGFLLPGRTIPMYPKHQFDSSTPSPLRFQEGWTVEGS